ncbi:MAG TPA: HlyD family efflux transporter periplasmic adaptor subunit [Kofleriaceae bacterium]|nr:HlyD family efflux transporter periplasmic adaptor subunit [Kofleriaceae bacterium]
MRTHRVYALSEVSQLARVIPARPGIAVVGTIGLLLALVVGAIAWAAVTEADVVVRAPARVRARSAPKLSFTETSGEQVAAAIAGRVAKVAVVEGQTVKAGDVLATLDSEQLQNDRARLAAIAASARDARDAAARMLELAQAQFEAAQDEREAELAQVSHEESQRWRKTSAEVALARTALDAARRDRDRVQALVGDGAASQSQLDQANEKVREADGQLGAAQVGGGTGRAEVLRKQIALAERDFAVHREELVQHVSSGNADLAAAQHNLANLDVELAKASVRATSAGVVSTVAARPGDVVQAGQQLFAIAPSDGVRIDAAIAAADIGSIKTGMRVRLRLDAFDWQRYGTLGGTITQIGNDAEPLSVGGAQVPIYVVRVELDRDVIGRGELRGQLKLGMTGVVDVVTERRQLLPLLVGHLHQALAIE